jgi:hypothetical protein
MYATGSAFFIRSSGFCWLLEEEIIPAVGCAVVRAFLVFLIRVGMALSRSISSLVTAAPLYKHKSLPYRYFAYPPWSMLVTKEPNTHSFATYSHLTPAIKQSAFTLLDSPQQHTQAPNSTPYMCAQHKTNENGTS